MDEVPMTDTYAPEWLCSYCEMEVGAFELFDGRLCGFGCIQSALREATTQLLEAAFDVFLGDER